MKFFWKEIGETRQKGPKMPDKDGEPRRFAAAIKRKAHGR